MYVYWGYDTKMKTVEQLKTIPTDSWLVIYNGHNALQYVKTQLPNQGLRSKWLSRSLAQQFASA